MKMHRNKSASSHQFAMIPRADVPRSKFRMQKTLKTAFDAGYLVPILCEEVLPGDSCNLSGTMFGRLATPIFPIMDNLYLETFFFFVPLRLVWPNVVKMFGEQNNPADSISYSVPQCVSPAGGYAIGSVFDFFGLPTVGQVGGGNTVTHSALPLRCYNLIYNEWFRDQNLQNSVLENVDDGPDIPADFALLRRGKRHDYFTSCLPWTQKFVAPSIPLGTSAPVKTASSPTVTGAQNVTSFAKTSDGTALGAFVITTGAAGTGQTAAGGGLGTSWYLNNLYADLASAVGASVNAVRQSVQIQKLLERDARGGTRYTEKIFSHFGVRSPDARLQRPEYLGGGKTPIQINPVAQTSASNLTGGTTPLGNVSAMGTTLANRHGFSYSATEHGYFIGLATVNADLTYQQGLRRHWSRLTQYDFYWPAFAMLGEQPVLNKEIYVRGDANDNNVFGYQERWAEYRYNPSEITGLMRSTAATAIDQWHLAQEFSALPTLNATFISDTPPLDRVLAVGAAANGQQLLLDVFYDTTWARPMPMYSVPGLMDHF